MHPTADLPQHGPRRIGQAMAAAFTSHEFEVWVAWLGFAIGVGSILRPEELAPTSLADVYPNGFLRVWGAFLAAGGIFKFTGLTLQNYRIRQVGLTLLGGSTFVIALSLLVLMFRGDISKALGAGACGLIVAAGISRFRRPGLTVLGGCATVIVVSLIFGGDLSRAFGVGTYGLFTAACISRFRSLGRLADAERNALRALADLEAGTRARARRRYHGRRPI